MFAGRHAFFQAALLLAASASGVFSQSGGFTRVEPGLERAVRWKWSVQPSPQTDWGLELPKPPPALPADATPTPIPLDRQNSYEVQRGDALAKIARRFDISVAALKKANNLEGDLIRVGDILRIPTPEEIAAMGLTKPTPPPAPAAPGRPAAASTTDAADPEILLFQIYLDRQNFSAGPIDGRTSFPFQKLMYLYQTANAEARDLDAFRAKARQVVGESLTRYTLKPEDFRFIAPPKAVAAPAEPPPTPGRKSTKPPAPVELPPPVYEEMVDSPMLAYRTPWEFVAERFHCDEGLLRRLNPQIRELPVAGTEFQVPNVTPFEIENAFAPPLRPPVNTAEPVSVSVFDLNRAEVYRGDRLVAVLPLSSARPGLRGRGTWTILDAIPRPRLATRQESRFAPRPTNPFFVGESPLEKPVVTLSEDQFLPAGPNNPAGILWINLAKSDSPDVLPFGLHGTSDPSRMQTQESLGGFRMSNWDIIRFARMVPMNSPLFWKDSEVAAPARPPEM